MDSSDDRVYHVAGTTTACFQFHWMDSKKELEDYISNLVNIFQFHWMDSYKGVRVPGRDDIPERLSIPLNGFFSFQITLSNLSPTTFNSIEWIHNARDFLDP